MASESHVSHQTSVGLYKTDTCASFCHPSLYPCHPRPWPPHLFLCLLDSLSRRSSLTLPLKVPASPQFLFTNSISHVPLGYQVYNSPSPTYMFPQMMVAITPASLSVFHMILPLMSFWVMIGLHPVSLSWLMINLGSENHSQALWTTSHLSIHGTQQNMC